MIVQKLHSKTKQKINNPFDISERDFEKQIKIIEGNSNPAYILVKVEEEETIQGALTLESLEVKKPENKVIEVGETKTKKTWDTAKAAAKPEKKRRGSTQKNSKKN